MNQTSRCISMWLLSLLCVLCEIFSKITFDIKHNFDTQDMVFEDFVLLNIYFASITKVQDIFTKSILSYLTCKQELRKTYSRVSRVSSLDG